MLHKACRHTAQSVSTCCTERVDMLHRACRHAAQSVFTQSPMAAWMQSSLVKFKAAVSSVTVIRQRTASAWRCSGVWNHLSDKNAPGVCQDVQVMCMATWVSANGVTSYEKAKRKFAMDVPENFNFTADVIDKWADMEKSGSLQKKVPAFWWIGDEGKEVKWTFTQLSENSKRVANILCGPCKLRPFDRVICILPRIPEWWLINLACIRAGIIIIPGPTQLTSKDIKQRLLMSESKCIIVDEGSVEKVEEIINDCPSVQTKMVVSSKSEKVGWLNFHGLYNHAKSDFKGIVTKSNDPMTIFFTSGTTGNPKMCEHTHVSYGLAHTITGRYWLDLTLNDIHWNLSDTGWAKSAYSSLFGPWLMGSCIFQQYSPKFDPGQVLKTFSTYPITSFCTVPTAYRSFVQDSPSSYKLKGVRNWISAGEPLNPEVIDSWKGETGFTIREGYGQTETVLLIGCFPCLDYREGSMGKASPGMDVRIIDDEGQEVKTGEEGNVGVKVKPHRPVGMFTRYVDEPERTLNSYIGDYYNTGDRAWRDKDGYFYFVGRCDDVITSAGYRIGPFEVESALIEHPAVAESAVISSPDKMRGAIVKAVIVLSNNYKLCDKETLIKELQEHVKSTTAPYKYPRKIEFVESLPKTVSGKIRRIELKEREWANPSDV